MKNIAVVFVFADDFVKKKKKKKKTRTRMVNSSGNQELFPRHLVLAFTRRPDEEMAIRYSSLC